MEGGQKLHHMNQQRPKGPARRPPSMVFKENVSFDKNPSSSVRVIQELVFSKISRLALRATPRKVFSNYG